MARTQFEQTPVKNTDAKNVEAVYAYAKSRNVMLFDFPSDVTPTRGTIDHCASVTANSKSGAKFALYYGKDGNVHCSPERANKRANVVRDASKPFTVSEMISELEWLEWIHHTARPGMPFKAIETIDATATGVIVTLGNGQKFVLTVTEQKTSK